MSPPPPRNPFVGLRPFEAEESYLFFGRNDQTTELLRLLYRTRFVAVVGSSGCGKSSLVRAGLIPRLEAGFLVADRDVWHIARMKPGARPLANLARSLGQTFDQQAADRLEEAIKEQGLQAVTNQVSNPLRESDGNLLLLVDQFEEIFRFGMTPSGESARSEALNFVALMLGLAEQRELPIYVILTMRSDFLGDCDIFLGLPEALNRSQYLVPRLTRQSRREAIEGPVRLFGAEISSRVTDRLLNEAGDALDDLPVLQHCLMRMWEKWSDQVGGPIDTEHYEGVGTMHGALSKDADAALQGLSQSELLWTKRLFQSLTEIDKSNRCVRRPVRLDEVVERTGAGREAVWKIIQRFRTEGRNFLVVSGQKPEENPLIDISHESLIRQWETLREWVEQESGSARIYTRLAETAALHTQGRASLYRDLDLRVALNWRDEEAPTEVWAQRYSERPFQEVMEFLNQSDQAQRKARAEEKERARRELRRTRVFSLVLVALLLIAVGAGAYALRLSRIARQQQRYAETQQRLAEERNQEIERLVLQSSELQGRIESFNQLLQGPIEDLITLRARSEPYTQSGSQVVDRANRPLYLITCWVEVPDVRKAEIREVIYRFPHDSFYPREKESRNWSNGYAISYTGWGCLNRVDVRIVMRDGSAVDTSFDLCRALGWR